MMEDNRVLKDEELKRVDGGSRRISESEPLWIVDGVVNNDRGVMPSDIESIDVLKDASSTAIYGSRGANGVIIVSSNSQKTEENK